MVSGDAHGNNRSEILFEFEDDSVGVQTGVQLARFLVAKIGVKRRRINGSLES